jgi:hypothetical protein
MRSAKIAVLLFAAPLCATLLLLGLVHVARAGSARVETASAPAAEVPRQAEAAGEAAGAAPSIQASRRISIPYGFAHILPLRNSGQEVLVSGHGSCTSGETFTVAVTVTDKMSTTAHGNVSDDCAGEATLLQWHLTATADSDPLAVGDGQVCGFVQTFDSYAAMTDSQQWCVDVRLGDYQFLPLVLPK